MKAALAYVGVFLAALASSACCWIPVLLGASAAGSLGISAALATWRPHLLALTAVFTCGGFYFAYKMPKETCWEGGRCSGNGRRKRRTNIAGMWGLVALAAGSAAYPNLMTSTGSKRRIPAAPVAADATKVLLNLRGVDCEGCIGSIKESLQSVPGVTGVTVDFPSRMAWVSVGRPRPTSQSLVSAVKKIGFGAEIGSLRTVREG